MIMKEIGLSGRGATLGSLATGFVNPSTFKTSGHNLSSRWVGSHVSVRSQARKWVS